MLLYHNHRDSDSAIQHRQASPINRRRAGLPVNARASARGQCQNEGLRAPRPSTISKPRTIQTQAPQAQQQKTRQVDLEADFDLLEDDDDFDEEVLAMLQEAEVAKSASKARGIRTASQNETNAQSSARAVPAASKPARAGSNTSHLDLSRASSSVAGPQPSKAKRTAQVIDLDDSDDEDDDKEVALMLLSSDGPPETGHGRREKHQHRSVSRSGIIQPIEID